MNSFSISFTFYCINLRFYFNRVLLNKFVTLPTPSPAIANEFRSKQSQFRFVSLFFLLTISRNRLKFYTKFFCSTKRIPSSIVCVLRTSNGMCSFHSLRCSHDSRSCVRFAFIKVKKKTSTNWSSKMSVTHTKYIRVMLPLSIVIHNSVWK